jgi:hypothetical protein
LTRSTTSTPTRRRCRNGTRPRQVQNRGKCGWSWGAPSGPPARGLTNDAMQ